MKIILFYSGLGDRGGISPDLRYLAEALSGRGLHPIVTRKLSEILRANYGRGTIINVYGCLPSFRNIAAMLICRLKGNTLVWTPVYHPHRRAIWKGAGIYRIMELFDRVAPHLARIAHAISAATDEEAAFFKSVGARRTEVIPLVVQTTHSRHEGASRQRARQRLGVGDEPVMLLIAAHSPRRKGMDFAAATLAELRLKLQNTALLVVGGGDLGGLADQPGVHAVGWCPDDMLIDAYRSADILFVPSLYEQFSRATIEAWACELPVILSDGVALARDAVRYDAGRVVAFDGHALAAAVLADALADPEWRREAGLRGRELVNNRYLPEYHVQASLNLYTSLA